ncbi:hypothetical protein RND81_01G096100 [Saponaria officinalis]|uniref:Transmembrane protein n=1 Tax=Saponaria officinalis TaxID=3572 RepID=A0AAW1NHR7_SAPOF
MNLKMLTSNNSTSTSMNKLCFAMTLVLLLSSTCFNSVRCKIIPNVDSSDHRPHVSIPTTVSTVDSIDHHDEKLVRKLAVRLVSGPSGKGPGH